MLMAHGLVARNVPSRVFTNTVGNFCQPVTTRSIARSLLRLLPTAPTEGELPPSPSSFVLSTNVPFPLFRHRMFPGVGASSGNVKRSILDSSGKLLNRVT